MGSRHGERSPRQPRDNKIVNKREHPLSKAADDAPREHTLQNRASRERLRLIARVTGRVVGTEPLDRQARAMAEEVRAIFKTDACMIRLLEGQDLVLLGAAGIPAENLYERIPLECGISQDILRQRRPVFVPDVRTHPIIATLRNRLPGGFEFVSYAGTPLLVGDRVVGMLGIYSVQMREDITDADLDYLQIIGNNISVAVMNDRLYAEVRQQRDQLAAEIAERQRAEQALRESEERYRRVVEDQTEFLVRWKPDGTRTFVNESYCRYFGKTREELIGSNFLLQVAEEDRERVRRKIASMTPTHSVLTDERRVIRPDGRIGWNEWTDRALFDEQGRLVELQSVGRDITERRRLQEELLQARKMESIGTLAGGIAHDFGNVLAVVMGNVSVLQREPGLSERTRELLAGIASAAERGSAFTQQLLAYAGGAARSLTAVDLNAILRTAARLLESARPEGVELGLNLGPDTPEILADTLQIEHVVLNLALNALEASQPPGRVEITTGRQKLEGVAAARLDVIAGEYAFLRVHDQGSGIQKEHMERLLEPFFTTKPMGRGMGLATTRAIVRDHLGQIRIESVPGNGTTVTAWLPAAKAPRHAPAAKRKGRKER